MEPERVNNYGLFFPVIPYDQVSAWTFYLQGYDLTVHLIQNMKNYLGQRQTDTKKTTITTKTAKTNTTQPKEAKKANPQKAKVVRPEAKAKTEKHREPKATAKKKLS